MAPLPPSERMPLKRTHSHPIRVTTALTHRLSRLAMDTHRNSTLRAQFLFFILFVIVLTAYLITTPFLPDLIHVHPITFNSHQSSTTSFSSSSLLNSHADDIWYFPNYKLLVVCADIPVRPTLLAWLATGLSGRPIHTSDDTVTSILANHSTPLPTSSIPSNVLKVSVYMNSYMRLIKAFKKHYACPLNSKTITNDNDQDKDKLSRPAVLALRNAAQVAGAGCMNISSFAEGLTAAVRHGVAHELDSWIRPQIGNGLAVGFDLVLDMDDVTEEWIMKPVRQRLPYGERMGSGSRMSMEVEEDEDVVLIPEKTASRLHAFAAVTSVGPVRYPGPVPVLEGEKIAKET